ncbi:MAG: hypothetical protein US86_C0001G0367 [Candidatus Daviesbacteria bacterium GW2011_GWA2_38_24]|uniref:Uncharacterized protein n=1 Tax=Candidatus Daviesbacteria bacterium GW2011_GWA2_38_24 TaxID=1618422 RepID=A0A0G0JWD6_9BACT|nr:MAG: hypothetical protein US86_C0001G0367 [Candidatus Daviesbacteria bacterium GW2011_GWA2_38_24]
MGKVNYQFTLPVSILKEGDSFIAYTPALDLSTVGDTFKEVLTQLGWQKVDKQLVPPVTSDRGDLFQIASPDVTSGSQ